MRECWLLAAMAGLLFVAGCAHPAGASAYRPIDLSQDLDAATLSRYRAAATEVVQAGQGGHMLVLERTNWWPLGLLAYWRQGKVEAMHRPGGGMLYMISRSRGYGPLSMLYVSNEGAMFGADGKRLNAMATSSVLWGHVAMSHAMGFSLADGRWQRHDSLGLLHHLINVSKHHGRLSVSLFSGPNPVTFGD